MALSNKNMPLPYYHVEPVSGMRQRRGRGAQLKYPLLLLGKVRDLNKFNENMMEQAVRLEIRQQTVIDLDFCKERQASALFTLARPAPVQKWAAASSAINVQRPFHTRGLYHLRLGQEVVARRIPVPRSQTWCTPGNLSSVEAELCKD